MSPTSLVGKKKKTLTVSTFFVLTLSTGVHLSLITSAKLWPISLEWIKYIIISQAPINANHTVLNHNLPLNDLETMKQIWLCHF